MTEQSCDSIHQPDTVATMARYLSIAHLEEISFDWMYKWGNRGQNKLTLMTTSRDRGVQMRAIAVSPVYLHLLAWLTSDHRGKKPADMAGQRGGGGEGRPSPKMQTFHLRYHREGIFSLSPGLQVANSLSGKHQKQPLFSKIQQEIFLFWRQWRRLGRKSEAYNDEMVSPLFALNFPPTTTYSFWPGWRHPKT